MARRTKRETYHLRHARDLADLRLRQVLSKSELQHKSLALRTSTLSRSSRTAASSAAAKPTSSIATSIPAASGSSVPVSGLIK